MTTKRRKSDAKSAMPASAKKNRQEIFSSKNQIMRDKIQLKQLDRELFIREKQDILNSKIDERLALRVGNACLSNMTHEQMMVPVTLNAKIFEGTSERHRMHKVPLQESIELNSSKLFKTGKRLLNEDVVSKQKKEKLEISKHQLYEARLVAEASQEAYQKSVAAYLHKQCMVEDSLDHQRAAKLMYKKLKLIQDELDKDIQSIPKRLQIQRKKIQEMNVELDEFTALMERAKRYAEMEAQAVVPINEEIASVTGHFKTLISTTRNELDDRRKGGQLAKFVTSREANAISFCEIPYILEVQLKRRSRIDNFFHLINGLKDAFMVSDIDHVVECFLDHADVKELLQAEKSQQEEEQSRLKTTLKQLSKTNMFLTFDGAKGKSICDSYNAALDQELSLLRQLEDPIAKKDKQENLLSLLKVSVCAIAQKLRPILLPNTERKVTGNIVEDMEFINEKMEKMLSIIESTTVEIGPVKPIMLSLFKQERIPSDCLRSNEYNTRFSSMTSLASFQMDMPGVASREVLKANSLTIAQEARKKRGKKK